MTGATLLSRGDTGALADLHAAAFPAPEAWSSKAISELLSLPTTRAMGMIKDEMLQGMLIVQFVAGEAEILTMATAPISRRRGLAGQLLNALEQRLRPAGLTKWLLDVAADNVGAIAFYEKCGFQVDGRRSNYYKRLEGKRVDAILMSKPVGGQITK